MKQISEARKPGSQDGLDDVLCCLEQHDSADEEEGGGGKGGRRRREGKLHTKCQVFEGGNALLDLVGSRAVPGRTKPVGG